MKEIEKIIEKMMSHYNVSNAIQLANQVGIHQSAISKWVKNDSVAAAKKKCRELGIFNDIFGSSSMYSISNQKNDFRNSSNSMQNFGSATIDNPTTKNELEGLDQSIVVLFKDVYQKFENEKNLKELFNILSELKWG